LKTLTKTLLANVKNLRQLIDYERLQWTTSDVEAVQYNDVIDFSAASGDVQASTPIVSESAARHSADQQEISGVNIVRYKTEICRQFDENGTCRYGDRCQFAHGRVEVRSVVRHPKYKTELCRTFHSTGFCPYGLRCHFIHNDEELHRDVSSVAAGTQPSGHATSSNSWPEIMKLDDVTFRHSHADWKRQKLGTVILDSPKMMLSCNSLTSLPIQRRLTASASTAAQGRAILARSAVYGNHHELTSL
jgi:butyrate response factor